MSTVAELVAGLRERFPFEWAEEWDRVGLLAGDAGAEVARVLVTLDPTLRAVAAARRAGANVVLTHHPAFLDTLETVTTEDAVGALVHDAIASGVALVGFHTNLDRSPEGADSLPRVLGLRVLGPLEAEGADASMPRAGRVCAAETGTTLGTLAAHVNAALGGAPRVWGDPATPVARIGVAPGSGGSLVEAAFAEGCDVLLTGELRYHGSLAALDRGLAVIEAGHDATEWPLAQVLADAVAALPGFGPDVVVFEPPTLCWWTA